MWRLLVTFLLICASYQERFYLKNILNEDNTETYADFNNTANSTGWVFLRITTSASDDDSK